jgi:hypothetical protein
VIGQLVLDGLKGCADRLRVCGIGGNPNGFTTSLVNFRNSLLARFGLASQQYYRVGLREADRSCFPCFTVNNMP